MKTLTQIPATKGQLTLITRMIGDVANSELVQAALGALDKDGAERLKSNPDFVSGLREFTIEKIGELSVTNKYADEMVESNYTYPKEYERKKISDQINMIAEIFELNSTEALEFAKNLPILPNGAEGWFAVPKVSVVAKKHFPAITNPAEQYCEAVKLVHKKLASSRSFHNYRDGEIVLSKLRQHSHTLGFLEKLEAEQSGDILIIAVQYGMKHRGKSVRRARETFSGNEFGLTSFILCCMALVHPERYVRFEELDNDCAGDEFAPGAGGGFSGAPVLSFCNGRLEFGTSVVSSAGGGCGSASAFVPPDTCNLNS